MIAIWRSFLPLPCVNVNKCHSFCIRSCPRKFHESSPSAAFSGLLGASKCISSFCAGALSLTPLGELTTIDRRSYSLVGWGGDTPFPYISLSTPPAPRSLASNLFSVSSRLLQCLCCMRLTVRLGLHRRCAWTIKRDRLWIRFGNTNVATHTGLSTLLDLIVFEPRLCITPVTDWYVTRATFRLPLETSYALPSKQMAEPDTTLWICRRDVYVPS